MNKFVIKSNARASVKVYSVGKYYAYKIIDINVT